METVRPDPVAAELADEMLSSEIPRTVMAEMIESGEAGEQVLEAGRTARGDAGNVHLPIGRESTRISLSNCPRGELTGVAHTHPIDSRNPEHSIPDYGNVVFGLADVSVVVGSETSHVVVAPEGDHEPVIETFQNELGADVASKDELVAAIEAGRIRPTDAVRRQIDSALGPLSYRADTAMPDLDAPAGAAPLTAAAAVCAAHSAPESPTPDSACSCLRHRSRAAGDGIRARAEAAPVNIREVVVGTAIGQLTSAAITTVVLG